jgi:ABC-type Fe3+-hydroxamate transport system substrate-binding protein
MDYFEVITDASTGQQTIRPYTPEEIAALSPTADDIRAQRNLLLATCDWTQVADAPADQAAWASYRQELRDITSQPGFPANVVWPEPPR